MGFGEARQQKITLIIEFSNNTMNIHEYPIAVFQKLIRIKGDLEHILEELTELINAKSQAWLEIEYTGDDIVSDLSQQINTHIEGGNLEIRRIKNKRIIDKAITQAHASEILEDLSEMEVFERCLSVNDIPKDQQAVLINCYQEIMTQVFEKDAQAE